MGRAQRDGRWWYYLDDGLYGSYSGQMFDHATYPIEALAASGPTYPSVLAGPTCDSIDVIRENIELPKLEQGDLVVGRVMGAYTWASASEFNFFPRATVLALDRGRLHARGGCADELEPPAGAQRRAAARRRMPAPGSLRWRGVPAPRGCRGAGRCSRADRAQEFAHARVARHRISVAASVYVPEALAAIQVLLRDYRTGEQHPIDPPLLDYLVRRRARASASTPCSA